MLKKSELNAFWFFVMLVTGCLACYVHGMAAAGGRLAHLSNEDLQQMGWYLTTLAGVAGIGCIYDHPLPKE